MEIEIVCATRLTREAFWAKSALGQSMRRLVGDRRLLTRVITQNKRGLPLIYNEALSSGEPTRIVVMIHDDVWLEDYFLADRLQEGLAQFDVLGVAGNRRRLPRQPSWGHADTKFQWDGPQHLSGAIAHGPQPFGAIDHFGQVAAECELLDGVFLAARRGRIHDAQCWFDPRFDFHFYDMDFCRTARGKGMRLGTWPICLTHQSGGAFAGEAWERGYRIYLDKWGD
jgi:hypothetical protein